MSNATTNITLLYPPSVNSYWRSIGRGRVIISSKGRLYRQSVIQDVSDLDLPILQGRLKVTIQAWMPDKRRRDLDNITKALLDALAHAMVYQDDEQIDDLRIMRMGIEKPGRVEIEIEEIDGTVRKT